MKKCEGIDALKLISVSNNAPYEAGITQGWNDCIDHLASRGLIKSQEGAEIAMLRGQLEAKQLVINQLETRLSQPQRVGWRPTHRHVKRGTDYQVIGDVVMQCEEFPVIDDKRLILYRDIDGKYWCRPPKEFNDGRFEAAPKDGEGE